VRASVFDDGQLMLMSAALLRRGDVVMAFSHSGQTAAVVEAARQARQNGAQLIALTNGSDTPLGRESDVALCTNLNSLPWAGENAAARLVQLSVVDALFSAWPRRITQRPRRTSATPPLPQAGAGSSVPSRIIMMTSLRSKWTAGKNICSSLTPRIQTLLKPTVCLLLMTRCTRPS
jgi:hypothetical protein